MPLYQFSSCNAGAIHSGHSSIQSVCLKGTRLGHRRRECLLRQSCLSQPLEKTRMLLWPYPRWASLTRRYAKLSRIGHTNLLASIHSAAASGVGKGTVVSAYESPVKPPPYTRSTTELPMTAAEYSGITILPLKRGFSFTVMGIQTIIGLLR
jgi:hypothetical protein